MGLLLQARVALAHLIAKFLRIAKISPIFKEAEMLSRKLPKFGKANNFVFLTDHLTVLF